MSYLDGVPFRTAVSLEGNSAGESAFIKAPAIELPDCTDILMSTMVGWPLPSLFLVGCSKGCSSWGRRGKENLFSMLVSCLLVVFSWNMR